MKENEKREPANPSAAKPNFNKPALKPAFNKPNNSRHAEREPEGDLQMKLAALKSKFK